MKPTTRSALIGGAVMAAIAATFALGRGPLPVHQLREKPFNASLHEDLATLTASSEWLETISKPRVVQVETIRPDDASDEPVALPPVRPPVRKAAVSGDICARHGLRKVNYGTKWRCRR